MIFFPNFLERLFIVLLLLLIVGILNAILTKERLTRLIKFMTVNVWSLLHRALMNEPRRRGLLPVNTDPLLIYTNPARGHSHPLFERLASLGIMGDRLRAPLNPSIQ